MANVMDYIGKRVDLELNDEGEVHNLTGTIESANSLGFVFKPFGSPKVALYETSQIEGLSLAEQKEPVLKARRLNPVDMGNVKRHLVDRHGYPLEDINEMKADEALRFHEEDVDHSPLSHYHAEAPAKEEKPTEVQGQEELDLGVDSVAVSADEDDDMPDF